MRFIIKSFPLIEVVLKHIEAITKSVELTSSYVAVESIVPGISGTVVIHGRNGKLCRYTTPIHLSAFLSHKSFRLQTENLYNTSFHQTLYNQSFISPFLLFFSKITPNTIVKTTSTIILQSINPFS